MLPFMLDAVSKGRLSLLRVVDLLAHGPNRVFNIANKGRMAIGYDGDLTIVDLKKQVTITNEIIASKSQWTPFEGETLNGFPTHTIAVSYTHLDVYKRQPY